MANPTITLTIQNPALPAGNYVAKLNQIHVSSKGISLVEEKNAPVSAQGIVEFQYGVVFKDGAVTAFDELQVDIYKVEGRTTKLLQSTGPLTDVSRQIDELGESAVAKMKTLNRVITISRQRRQVSGKPTTILEQFDEVFDDPTLTALLKDSKTAPDTIDEIFKSRESFDFLNAKVLKLLTQKAAVGEWSNGVARQKMQWYSKRHLRKYLNARVLESKAGKGKRAVWFALVDGRLPATVEWLPSISDDQAFIAVDRAINRKEIPPVDVKSEVPPVLEIIKRWVDANVDSRLKDKNGFQRALNFLEPGFAGSGYDFAEASAHLKKLILQRRNWNSGDLAGMHRSLVDGLVDFAAQKEAERLEAESKKKGQVPVNNPPSKRTSVGSLVKVIKRVASGKTSAATVPAQQPAGLEQHKIQVRKAGTFILSQSEVLSEFFGIAAALSNNFVVLDQLLDLSARKGVIGKVKLTKPEDLADVTGAEWKAWMAQQPQSNNILNHIGIRGKYQKPTVELQTKLIANCATSVYDLLGRLYPNRRFVSEVNRVKLPAALSRSWGTVKGFMTSYAKDINITTCSPKAWDMLLSRDLPAAERKRILALMPEVKAWQLAHAILPDAYDHLRAVKVREAVQTAGIAQPGRNVVKDILSMGELKFLNSWQEVNVDPQKASMEEKIRNASEGRAIFKRSKRQTYYKYIYTNGQAEGSTTLDPSGGVSSLAPDAGTMYSLTLGLSRRPVQQVSWDALFSGKDYCACDEDESVLSASAYVVDMLNWLNTIPGGGVNGSAPTTALAQLLQRRPDLAHIALSKQNTFTTLPYIDIVNELLERKLYIHNTPLYSDPVNLFNESSGGVSHIVTTGTSADRERTPEVIHRSVWDIAYRIKLMTAKGIHLPFDYWLEETRCWLKAAGTSLPEIMFLDAGKYSVYENAGLLSAARDYGLPATPGVIKGALQQSDAGEYVAISYADKQLLTGLIAYQVAEIYDDTIDRIAKKIPALLDILIAKLLLTDAPPDGSPGILFGRIPKEEVQKEYFKLFREILDSRFIQASSNGVGRVQVNFLDDSCSIEPGSAEIINYTPQTFTNLFLFCKLLAKLQWRPWQLDWVISQSGGGINDALISNICNAKRIQDTCGMTLEEMLCSCFGFYTNLVFDNTEPVAEAKHKAIFNGEASWHSPLFSLLASIESNGYPSTDRLRDYSYWAGAGNAPATFLLYGVESSNVARVFKITVDELNAIAPTLGIVNTTPLTADLLQQIYKLVIISRCLKVPVESLCRLPEMRVFTMGSVANLLAWVLQYRARKKSVKNYPVLVDLLDPNSNLLHQTEDLRTQRTTVVQELNDNVRQILQFFALGDTNALVKKYGAGGLSPNYVAEIATTMGNLMPPLEQGDFSAVINSMLAATLWPRLNAVASTDAFQLYRSPVSPESAQIAGNHAYTNGHFLISARSDMKLKIVPAAGVNVVSFSIGTVANTGLVTNAVQTEYVLTGEMVYYLSVQCNGGFTLEVGEIRDTSSIEFWYFSDGLVLAGGGNLDRNAFLALFHHSILVFTRLVRIVREFGFDQNDLRYLSDTASPASVSMQAVNFVSLLDKQLSDAQLVAAIDRLACFSTLRKAMRSTDFPVQLLDRTILPYTIPVGAPFTASVNAAYANTLAEALRVGAAAITSILDSYRLKLKPVLIATQNQPIAEVYNRVPELLVEQVIDWVTRFKSDITCITPLLRVTEVGVVPTSQLAWEFKEAAHERVLIATRKLAGDSLDSKQKEVADEMRKKRREAMLDFLVSGNAYGGQVIINRAKRSKQSIGTELLVPVEIAPCRKTSRIREAISAIQRFVTECNLGTVREIKLSDQETRQWETYRREFRIWQVAKIILRSPEDYLLPRLRIDKTPIYSQAESELEQDEATHDSAEMVVRNFVRSLHDISSLEIPSVISHTIETGEKITILIGRTRSNPHKYYFCSMMESDQLRNWSPWYEVTVEIEGDHILPVIHHGYLYIFWPSIKVSNDKEARNELRYEDLEPGKFEVKLNYTRLEEVVDNEFPKRIKWAKKRQSKTSLDVFIESASDFREKLDLESKTDRIHLLSKSDPGDFGNLNIFVGYWEALKEGVTLHWDEDVLTQAWNEIRGILSTQMNYSFVIGSCVVDVRKEDNVADVSYLPDSLNDAAEDAHDWYVEMFGLNSWTYTSGSQIRNSVYVNKVVSMFFDSEQMNSFESSLVSGDLDGADANLIRLVDLAAVFDAGIGVYVTDVSGASTFRETSSAKNAGRSLEDIVDQARLALNLNYGNSFGSLYELYQKGRFVLNACGDLHITEVGGTLANSVIPHSASHETPETTIRNQRLYQDNGDMVSLWKTWNSFSEQISKDIIFYNTPTTFALTVDPSSMPFRIAKSNQNNFVFQDANHSFLVMPTVESTWNVQTGTFIPYSPQTLNGILVGNRNLSGFFRSNYITSENILYQATDKGKFGGAKYRVGAVPHDKQLANTNAKLIYGQSEKIAIALSSRVQEKGFRSGERVIAAAKDFPGENILRTAVVQNYGVGLFDKGRAFKQVIESASYKLLPLGHPYACEYLSQIGVAKKGVDLLFKISRYQGQSEGPALSLFGYGPNRYNVRDQDLVDYSQAEPDVYFDKDHVFSRYNHELFFHLPFRIAVNFSDNGRFEEAYKWFHYIFDPRCADGRSSPWGFVPFKRNQIMPSLEERTRVSVDDPFNPYAQAEINQQVYMKAVVFKYIDNLIAWADNEFTLYTGESLDRAEILYRDALSILGRPPQEIVKDNNKRDLSYTQLYSDASGNESIATIDTEDVPTETSGEEETAVDEVVLTAMTPDDYFCHYSSSKLNDYFALIDQRLFNLNNCRDIDGNVREVALFQPRLSPWLLVLARAAGLDLGAVLSFRAETAGYRWEFIQQKAMDYTEFAARFADKLQAALEKKDSGALMILRESHQKEILKSTREIRRLNIRDAEIGLRQMERSRESVEFRLDYYASRPRVNSQEAEEVEKNKQAFGWDISAQALETLRSALSVIPQIGAIAGPSGGATTEFGGLNLGHMGSALASGARMVASILRHESYLAGVSGSRQRRFDDWQFQANSARREIKQMEQQVLAAQLRIDIAERELESIEQQQEQSDAVLDFMRNQFTSEEFYEWQVKDIMKLFRTAYAMAFDMAKRAEAAYFRDTLRSNDRIIQAGNWLSDRKGLGSTDRLLSQLRQLDQAYWLNINPANQVSKRLSVSLAMNFPDQLVALQTTGNCVIAIQGYIFDMHWPDHYWRRIKSVSITIPCIKGPFAPINARLTLRKGNIRTNPLTTGYVDDGINYTASDQTFRAFAETNDANQDTGRLQFDDGNRLLNAFEGAGLDDSSWTLQLDRDFNKIDFSTVSDVILTFEFTALISSERRNNLINVIKTGISNLVQDVKQLLSLKGFFAPQWEVFTSGIAGANDVVELNSALETLVGMPLNTFIGAQWTAFYVMGNDEFNLSTMGSYVLQGGDFTNPATGDISIKAIWDNHPVPINPDPNEDDVALKARLKDIVLYYRATKP